MLKILTNSPLLRRLNQEERFINNIASKHSSLVIKLQEKIANRVDAHDEYNHLVYQKNRPKNKFKKTLMSVGTVSTLDGYWQNKFENFLGVKLPSIRIHTDHNALVQTEKYNAYSYAQGNNIYLGKGTKPIDTVEGQSTIAHEITHVLQQKYLDMSSANEMVDPSSLLEQKAQIVEDRVRVTKGINRSSKNYFRKWDVLPAKSYLSNIININKNIQRWSWNSAWKSSKNIGNSLAHSAGVVAEGMSSVAKLSASGYTGMVSVGADTLGYDDVANKYSRITKNLQSSASNDINDATRHFSKSGKYGNNAISQLINDKDMFSKKNIDKTVGARDLHYGRNKYNKVLLDEVEAQSLNWTKLDDDKSIYHQMGEGNENNHKYVSPDGHSEAVFYGKDGIGAEGTSINSIENEATYNYASPQGISAIGHVALDVLPYYLWGNSKNDSATFSERLTGSYDRKNNPIQRKILQKYQNPVQRWSLGGAWDSVSDVLSDTAGSLVNGVKNVGSSVGKFASNTGTKIADKWNNSSIGKDINTHGKDYLDIGLNTLSAAGKITAGVVTAAGTGLFTGGAGFVTGGVMIAGGLSDINKVVKGGHKTYLKHTGESDEASEKNKHGLLGLVGLNSAEKFAKNNKYMKLGSTALDYTSGMLTAGTALHQAGGLFNSAKTSMHYGKKTISTVMTKLARGAYKNPNMLKGVMKTAQNSISSAKWAYGKSAQKVLSGISGFVTQPIKLYQNLNEQLGEKEPIQRKILQKYQNPVQRWSLSGAWDSVSDTASDIVGTAVDGIGHGVQWVDNKYKDGLSSIGNGAKEIGSNIANKWNNSSVGQTVNRGVTDGLAYVGDGAKEIGSSISNKWNGSTIGKNINQVAQHIGDKYQNLDIAGNKYVQSAKYGAFGLLDTATAVGKGALAVGTSVTGIGAVAFGAAATLDVNDAYKNFKNAFKLATSDTTGKTKKERIDLFNSTTAQTNGMIGDLGDVASRVGINSVGDRLKSVDNFVSDSAMLRTLQVGTDLFIPAGITKQALKHGRVASRFTKISNKTVKQIDKFDAIKPLSRNIPEDVIEFATKQKNLYKRTKNVKLRGKQKRLYNEQREVAKLLKNPENTNYGLLDKMMQKSNNSALKQKSYLDRSIKEGLMQSRPSFSENIKGFGQSLFKHATPFFLRETRTAIKAPSLLGVTSAFKDYKAFSEVDESVRRMGEKFGSGSVLQNPIQPQHNVDTPTLRYAKKNRDSIHTPKASYSNKNLKSNSNISDSLDELSIKMFMKLKSEIGLEYARTGR